VNFLIIVLFIIYIGSVNATAIGSSTGLKLPRFVSTKSNESNLRIGAHKDYPIILTYNIKNIPLEIVDEYEIWRKIIDINGNQGWMHESLLKGNRYGIIKTFHDQPAQIYNKPRGITIGTIGNRNIIKIKKCLNLWCFISYNKFRGWINKKNIWGVYDEEKFNIPFYHFFINLFWEAIK